MSQPPYPPPPAEDPRTAQLSSQPVGRPTGAHPAQTQHPVQHPVQQPLHPSAPVHPGPQSGQPVGPPPLPAQQGLTGPQEYRAPQGYDPAFPAAPTGPMDWVPGFPGEQPPPHPSAPVPHDTGRAPRVGASQRTPADRATLSGTVLGVLGLIVLELGLALDLGGVSLWSALPTWSAFATVAALVALVPFVPSRGGLSRRQAWQVGAAGAAGLVLFWVLVVLPGVASDRGFVLTAGVALSAGALWLVHDRRR